MTFQQWGFEAELHFSLLTRATLTALACPLNLWVGYPQDNSPAKIVHAVVFIILSRFHADWGFLKGDGVAVKIFHHLSKAGTQILSYFMVLNLVGVEIGWMEVEDGRQQCEVCLNVLFMVLCQCDFSKMSQQDSKIKSMH